LGVRDWVERGVTREENPGILVSTLSKTALHFKSGLRRFVMTEQLPPTGEERWWTWACALGLLIGRGD
jgi:D-serine deaminase-like pyridoxal phosphate-dependent protein